MVQWQNLRAVCSESCARGFTIACQWDTSTAFLYAPLEPGTEVYVKLSAGLGQFCGVDSDYVRLIKNTYGLPSAPNAFERFRKEVLTNKCGCKPCPHDEAVFVKQEGDEYIFICT